MFSIGLSLANANEAESSEHKYLNRLVVFPIETSKEFRGLADKLWWDVRSQLTKNLKFMVASKEFLVRKEVFKARKRISSVDALILGRLLDAHGIVTYYLNQRVLNMSVRDGRSGQVLWEKKLQLLASVPIKNQLGKALKNLTGQFISDMPYQGHLLSDDIKSSPVFKDGTQMYARVKISQQEKLKVGESIEFFRLLPNSLKPLFMGNFDEIRLARGTIVDAKGEDRLVEIKSIVSGVKLREGDLLRISSIFKNKKSQIIGHEKSIQTIESSVYSPEYDEKEEEYRARGPLVTALTFVLNFGVFLLLAL